MVGKQRKLGRKPSHVIPRQPNLYRERKLWKSGAASVAGCDEAGRGAWAGPLVAAAVCLPRAGRDRARLTRSLSSADVEIRDSKQLKHLQRLRIVELVRDHGVASSIAEIDVATLDELGIACAGRLALAMAISGLDPRPDYALVDAFYLPGLEIPHDAIVHGDRRSSSIALASIIAKVRRDQLLCEFGSQFPGYGFATHKGYGTKCHRANLEERGVSPIHRKSFAPIARLLQDG